MLLFLSVFIFLFGLSIGSFLNCLVWRLHERESLWDRSYCPKCRARIAWFDNIPVLSFLLLRGKCRRCGRGISWQYPVVELITGVLFLVAFLLDIGEIAGINAINFQFSIFNFQSIFNDQFSTFTVFNSRLLILLFRDWFVIAVMAVIFIYDLRWYLILDIITLPACAIVLALNLLLGMNWQNLLFSGIIGGGFFFLQFAVSRGKWIGGGDIRLGVLMGLILGWPIVLVALFIAYLTGAAVGIGLIAAGKKTWGEQIPFGVFLSSATVIALFLGDRLLNWYLHYFGII